MSDDNLSQSSFPEFEIVNPETTRADVVSPKRTRSKDKDTHSDLELPDNLDEVEANNSLDMLSRLIPLELERARVGEIAEYPEVDPILPARWEDLKDAAETRGVFQVIVEKLRAVSAYQQLAKLITLSKSEGYVWVVFGRPGSGKSAFFQTLEYKFKNKVRTLIINGNKLSFSLTDQMAFSDFLEEKIHTHVRKHGNQIPLVVILEGREQKMSSDERSAIAQALKNVLRSPGPGKNVVFVLPVTNTNQGTLFLNEVEETGIAIAKGGLYTFVGPTSETHADIVAELFIILNNKDTEEYGLLRSDLDDFASSQQTIGDYIRTIWDEIHEKNNSYKSIVNAYGYRPITVITCFICPDPAYNMQRTVKGMTSGPYGKINIGEITRATRGNRSKQWENREQILAKIIHTLDIRVVEFPIDVIVKLLYYYGWSAGGYTGRRRIKGAIEIVDTRLKEKKIKYKQPESMKQNIRQQLSASNLFRIIVGEETRRLDGTRRSHLPDEEAPQSELERRNREHVSRAVVELACEMAGNYQYELHTMISKALEDALSEPGNLYTRLAEAKVYPEAWLTCLDDHGVEQKPVRVDIAIDTKERLYLLEFHWRNKSISDADIASYVLGKITQSYLALPLIKALLES